MLELDVLRGTASSDSRCDIAERVRRDSKEPRVRADHAKKPGLA